MTAFRCASPARRRALAALALLSAAAPLALRAQTINAGPYVPSPSMIVDEMLKLGGVKADDYVLDLGSGDGRIVITAAQRFGASGMGVDINPDLVKLANDNAAKAGVAQRVKFAQRDLFEMSLAEPTLVTVYLLPNTVTKLVPKMLGEMKPGARVVSHDYPLSPWRHDRYIQFDTEEKVPISGTTRTVLYLYIVPARVAGQWQVELPPAVSKAPVRLDLTQDADRVSAAATAGGRPTPVGDVTVRGETVRIPLTGLPGGRGVVLEGRARGDVMEGTLPGSGGAWRATRVAK
jgi:SAM-dependent methyltransferase